MRRRLALVAALAALAGLGGAASARAETLVIGMPGKFFDPPRATMVAGDTVVFRNYDLATHDVRIAAGGFDSGPIGRFGSWAQSIGQPGGYPFVCTLHAFMSGDLDVVAATLATGTGTVLAGEPIELSGRAPAGSAQLALERSTPEGGWIALDGVTPAPDGTFRTTAAAVEGAAYRVSSAAGSSPAVSPHVTARVDLHLDVRRSRRHRTLRVHAMPAPAGFVATLELYSPWRYAWRPARRVALDADGSARFRVRASRRAFARVTLSRRARGPALVHSRVIRLWTGRGARDPDTIGPPGSGQDGVGGGHDGGH